MKANDILVHMVSEGFNLLMCGLLFSTTDNVTDFFAIFGTDAQVDGTIEDNRMYFYCFEMPGHSFRFMPTPDVVAHGSLTDAYMWTIDEQ